MSEWICTQCGKVVIADSYKCCGKVEEFSAEKHVSLLVGKSNAWINVWQRWGRHPLLEKISLEFTNEGCYSAASVLNTFIKRLLETIHYESED